jgi:hypothetical protein
MENELTQSTSYQMPNGMSAFYQGIRGAGNETYHLFIGTTPAPDWFRFHHIPVGDFELKENRVISNSHVYETQHRPDIVDREIFQLMREQFQRLNKQGI